MEKIVIEKRQTNTLRFMMLCFFLMLISVSIWMIGMKERKVIITFLGLLNEVIFSIGFFIFLNKALQKKPLITITFDGIIDSSSSNSVGFIPFGDIDKFLIMDLPQSKAIGIIPKNHEVFIHKLSPMKQEIARANITKQRPPFSLNLDNAKDMSLEDIYTLLKKRLDDYSCLYD